MAEKTAVDTVTASNPFTDTSNPLLDPSSSQFKHREWLRTITTVKAQDAERSPPRLVGIAYRNLSVYGLAKHADYQRTFGNYPLVLLTRLRRLANNAPKDNVCILTSFDGLVRSGESLLVLGRPGRQVHIH